MNLQIDYNGTKKLIQRQLANLFAYDPAEDGALLEPAFQDAIVRCGIMFCRDQQQILSAGWPTKFQSVPQRAIHHISILSG
jgi:hypothetical protein